MVRHRGQTKEFDYSAPNGYSVCCAAFYADCVHELRPVQQGFRLALVYNLIHSPNAPTPALADCDDLVSSICAALKSWGEDGESADHTIYMLEHQ